jgi:hypothetical protein
MSVVASQSEPPTILDANTAQHIAKPSINGSDFIIRVAPCSPWFRRISFRDREVYHWQWMNGVGLLMVLATSSVAVSLGPKLGPEMPRDGAIIFGDLIGKLRWLPRVLLKGVASRLRIS